MDVYMTIYRGETAADEIEINIKGFFEEENASLEILEVVNTFDDKPIELTDEEREYVATTEFDEWLHSEGLSDLMGEHRDVYWAENEATVVEVEEYETTSERIVSAQNIHLWGTNA